MRRNWPSCLCITSASMAEPPSSFWLYICLPLCHVSTSPLSDSSWYLCENQYMVSGKFIFFQSQLWSRQDGLLIPQDSSGMWSKLFQSLRISFYFLILFLFFFAERPGTKAFSFSCLFVQREYIAPGESDSHLGTQGKLAFKCKQENVRQRRKEGRKERREGGREGRKKGRQKFWPHCNDGSRLN